VSRRVARALHRYCIGRPCRVIPSGGQDYLVRVYLGHWRGWRAYLHRYLVADGERWLHDHPANGASLVLSGQYIEEVLPALGAVSRGYCRRWFNWIPARKFHRISSVLPNTWTLFVHGRHHKGWGFVEGLEFDGRPATLYHNPFDQSQSGGAHWWEAPDCLTYPPPGVA